jgi:hypothetical protein
MPDTNTTNELALNDKQLFNMAVELENKRASLMTTGDADKLAQILSDDLYYAHSSMRANVTTSRNTGLVYSFIASLKRRSKRSFR